LANRFLTPFNPTCFPAAASWPSSTASSRCSSGTSCPDPSRTISSARTTPRKCAQRRAGKCLQLAFPSVASASSCYSSASLGVPPLAHQEKATASQPAKESLNRNDSHPPWTVDRAGDCATLEMPCPEKSGPGVRIPPSPLLRNRISNGCRKRRPRYKCANTRRLLHSQPLVS
jgi:hypothetical protein